MGEQRVVLITGASAGIGWASAKRLVKRGFIVIGASRRGKAPSGCSGLVMDVRTDEEVHRGIEEIIEKNGRLDAVVACAGFGLAGAVENTPMQTVKDQFETNFFGIVRVVQNALPHMRKAGGGRIILIGSIGGVIGIPYQTYYSASKFALEGYTEGIAYEIQPFGIDISIVEPGNVKTEFTAVRRNVVLDPAVGESTREVNDPYDKACEKAVSLMEKGEVAGVDPDKVAKAIEKLIMAKRPRRKVSVGKLGERIGIPAKRLMNQRLFEFGAKKSLGV